MKDQILKSGMWAVALTMIVFSSCQKDLIEPVKQATDEITNTDVNISALADEADADYLASDVRGGDETDAFYALNDGLTEAYLLDAASFDAQGREVPAQLIKCLRGVKPDSAQIIAIKRALAAYEDCKSDAIKKHRAAYAELKDRVEAARKELLKKYRNNEITKEEFIKGMKLLREKFQKALKAIKESYAKSLKACYEKFLAHLKTILSERQWKAFIDCLRN